ncbi:hypothetical protein B0J12DRAFT_40564 [Macrophomina phaseolina]|uniref:Uncharacterized protein n=1 Tax=Macrophomina phaseolina TaxID=35725 RepID=A0ABQ8GWD1_9PEZI|nr:hypothetical protein B0J12DRAFT_40564 [Macrophomina phaseolina]
MPCVPGVEWGAVPYRNKAFQVKRYMTFHRTDSRGTLRFPTPTHITCLPSCFQEQSLRRFQPQGVQAPYTAPALPIQHNELGVILDPRVSPVVMDTVSGKQVAAPQLGNYANYNLPFFPYYDQQHNLGNGIATIPLSGQASASSSYFMTVSNAPTLDHRTLQNFSNPQFMLAGHIPQAGALQGKQYHTVHEEQMEGDDQGLNQSMIDPIGFDAIDTVHIAMSNFSTSSTRATGMPESDFESSQVQNADLTSTQATTLGSEASVQDKE